MAQTTTIWLKVLELVTILIVVKLANFNKNEVKIDITLALLSYQSLSL